MNALLPLFAADVGDHHRPANLLAAARALTPQLNRSRPLDRKLVANVMTMAFGASDAHCRRINAVLAQGEWILGDRFSACDGYALVFFVWALRIELDLADLPHFVRLARQMTARPAVARVLQREGAMDQIARAVDRWSRTRPGSRGW